MARQANPPAIKAFFGAMEKRIALRAWADGKKVVEIKGRKFKLRKDVRNIKKSMPDQSIREFHEEWLIVTPAGKAQVPMASFALGENMRSK